jgi:hypothetical protein
VQWYAHNLEPVSFIVWDNLSSLNQALKSLKETDTQATGELYHVGPNLSSLNQALKSLKETDAQATGELYHVETNLSLHN